LTDGKDGRTAATFVFDVTAFGFGVGAPAAFGFGVDVMAWIEAWPRRVCTTLTSWSIYKAARTA
jgi:hypothetical protein